MRLIAHKGYYELVIIVNNEQCFFFNTFQGPVCKAASQTVQVMGLQYKAI